VQYSGDLRLPCYKRRLRASEIACKEGRKVKDPIMYKDMFDNDINNVFEPG